MSRADLDAVLAALARVAPTELVWARGLMHPGGPHRRLAGTFSPISIGDDECLVFGRLIEALRPADAFVIGNAFGLSAAYIARVMQQHGGRSVVTLDSQDEGQGARCAEVAEALRRELGLTILTNKKGRSPEDVPGAVAVERHDLVFIDGLHAWPQASYDLCATLPYADDDTVFVWHDDWIPGVRDSVADGVLRGFRCLWIRTSCEMVVGARSERAFANLRRVFPEASDKPLPHGAFTHAWIAARMAAEHYGRGRWG